MAKPSKRRESTSERLWQVKLGNAPAYRSFVCGGHLVFWTGSQIKSIEVSTGKAVAQAKAASGAPWVEADEVWVPTTAGFEVRVPSTLAVKREVSIPRPKSPAGALRFLGGVARVHGTVAYRLAQTTKPTKVGTELRHEYFLHAHDLKTKQQRFLVTLASTSNPSVHGECSRDQFAVSFRRKNDYEVVFGSTTDGIVAGRVTRLLGNIGLVGGQLVERGGPTPTLPRKPPPEILRNGAWKVLDCAGVVESIGDQLYCVGHRELTRLDDAVAVAARAPIATPKSSVDESRDPSASVCLAGSALMVVERCDALPGPPAPMEATTTYRVTRRDPKTLRELGDLGTFEELPMLHLLGRVEDVYVARAFGCFVGLRLPE